MPDPYKEQIELDLKRTFTEDEAFTSNQQYQENMMNILQSYAKRNTSVGYCQGMNYLAGMIVRVIDNEEDAFWVLTSLFESILPLDYYCLMTEILVDQKVFLQILQKKKPKLYKHLQSLGLDFAIISFQWLVWLLASNMSQVISETIWDFLFLEGSVSIFRAFLAILNILEAEIMKQTEFNELYVLLDTRPKEIITNQEEFIKQMSKFWGLKQHHIERLRSTYRPIIIKEQENVWVDTSRSGCPTPSDSSIFRRVKLLNKFFLLNRAMRQCKNDAVASWDEGDLCLTGKLKCSMNWPIWLYDFTVRSRITNYFIFKISAPVKVINDYFGEEQNEEYSGGVDEINYLLVPFQNKNITIYDNNQDKKRKRMQSAHLWDSIVSSDDSTSEQLDQNQLMMSRETHPCVFNGFEKHFQKLFDEENDTLFQNWTIHGSYGGELQSLNWSDTFIKEILSSKEIWKLKEKNQNIDKDEHKKLFSWQDNRHQSIRVPDSQLDKIQEELKSSLSQQSQATLTEKKEDPIKDFERFGSLWVPECEVERQIFENAVSIATQNLKPEISEHCSSLF